VIIFYSSFHTPIMAAAEVIKRLSTRATAAEQMIHLLRKQVDGIRQSSGCAAGTGFFFRPFVNFQKKMYDLKKKNIISEMTF
jgi:hypothetical protein